MDVSLVVAYHGPGFSDIMQTHHLRHQVAETLERLGANIPLSYTAPMGTTDAYVAAVVEKVRAELAHIPDGEAVAVHLSGHGLPTGMCGEYDCGADAYHRFSADLYHRVSSALRSAIKRSGRWEAFRLYGDGADDEDDPEDEVDSPLEALDKRAADGFRHVIDVPHEFDANSRDTLIVLRLGYGRQAPDWNAAWESRFSYKGMDVKLANVSGQEGLKTTAYERVIRDALAGLAAPVALAQPGAGAAAPPAPVRHEVTKIAAHAMTESSPPGGTTSHPVAAAPNSPLFDHVGGGSGKPGESGLTSTATHHAADQGEGASSATAFLLALVGGAAVAAGLLRRGATVTTKAVLAGVGVQLVGVGWDVHEHARVGEGVHLLENSGHWLAASGLAATLVAAMAMMRTRREPGQMDRPVADEATSEGVDR